MNDKMTALVNYAPEPGSVRLEEVPVPEIQDADVLLTVKAVGICGSDLHQFHGKQSWKVNYPVVLGHEFCGVIAKTGAAVKAFRTGERVVSETAAVIDPQSPFVRSGLYNLDPSRMGFGYAVNGAMAQYVKVPERCLHRIPANVSFETAALCEPCCVAYNAACLNSPIHPGCSVVVIGPGAIGLLCAEMARIAGAKPLIVAGTAADHRRLELARRIGATETLSGPEEEIVRRVKVLGDGYGADVVIDAAGVSAALQLALKLVRPGGHITKVGWGPQPCNFSLDPLVQQAVTLQGCFSHNWPIWERVLAMLASEQLSLTPVLSRVAPLTSWRECFEGMHKGELLKVVLQP